jgi:ribokinase
MNVLTGGAMLDTIVAIAGDKTEQMKMRNAESSFFLLEKGHKTEAEPISTHCGGGAVNATVAAARLDHATSVIIKVGNDAKAKTILDRLVEEGVDLNAASVVKFVDAQSGLLTHSTLEKELQHAADPPLYSRSI